MAAELGLDELRVNALTNLGPARNQLGYYDAAVADLEHAIAVGTKLGSAEVIRAYVNLASVRAGQGDMREARRLHEEGFELANRVGHGPSLRFLRAELADDAWFLGDWEPLVRTADEYEAEAAGGTPHYLLGTLLGRRGFVRIARGDLEGGIADSERSLELARDAKDPQALAPALGTSAYALFIGERRQEALARVDELLADARLLDWALSPPLALAVAGLGRTAAALAILGDHLTPWHAAFEAVLRGDVVQAADICGESGIRPGEALLRLSAAAQLVAEGRRVEADEQLRKALAFWRSVGATRYIRESEALLAAAS